MLLHCCLFILDLRGSKNAPPCRMFQPHLLHQAKYLSFELKSWKNILLFFFSLLMPPLLINFLSKSVIATNNKTHRKIRQIALIKHFYFHLTSPVSKSGRCLSSYVHMTYKNRQASEEKRRRKSDFHHYVHQYRTSYFNHTINTRKQT